MNKKVIISKNNLNQTNFLGNIQSLCFWLGWFPYLSLNSLLDIWNIPFNDFLARSKLQRENSEEGKPRENRSKLTIHATQDATTSATDDNLVDNATVSATAQMNRQMTPGSEMTPGWI